MNNETNNNLSTRFFFLLLISLILQATKEREQPTFICMEMECHNTSTTPKASIATCNLGRTGLTAHSNGLGGLPQPFLLMLIQIWFQDFLAVGVVCVYPFDLNGCQQLGVDQFSLVWGLHNIIINGR